MNLSFKEITETIKSSNNAVITKSYKDTLGFQYIKFQATDLALNNIKRTLGIHPDNNVIIQRECTPVGLSTIYRFCYNYYQLASEPTQSN